MSCYHPKQATTLSKMIDMNLEPYIPKFEGISESASKEYSLEKAMEKMKEEWGEVRRNTNKQTTKQSKETIQT